MENFEGGSGNPEIKDIKKLGLGARLKLAAAIALGAASLNPSETGTSKVETPNEIRSPEPPKPDIS